MIHEQMGIVGWLLVTNINPGDETLVSLVMVTRTWMV